MEEEKDDNIETDVKEEIKVDDSILLSIKKLLGLSKDCTDFDTDIIIHINTVLINLSQLGIILPKNYAISDASNLWSEIIAKDDYLELIKTYMYLKVKMIFDPPLSSAVLEANQNMINEYEWRITVQVDENKLNKEEEV